MGLLEAIQCPADVRRLPHGELQQLAYEVWQRLIEEVPHTEGSFGAWS